MPTANRRPFDPPAAVLNKSWGLDELAAPSSDVIAECIGVSTASSRGRYSIVLTLCCVEVPYSELSCWFNVERCGGKNKANEYRMNKRSKLARLYRVSLGCEPRALNTARATANHLIGCEFIVNPELRNGKLETKAAEPLHPKKADSFSSTGTPYTSKLRGKNSIKTQVEINSKSIGNQLEVNCKSIVNQLEKPPRGIDSKGCRASQVPLTINHTPKHHSPVTIHPIPNAHTDNEERVIEGKQKPNELQGDYFNRVIDESGFLD